jgi:hypothetical protein
MTMINTSIKKINFELSKLLKINDPDEQVKNDIEIHKGNLKLLTDLLNIALENKK